MRLTKDFYCFICGHNFRSKVYIGSVKCPLCNKTTNVVARGHPFYNEKEVQKDEH